MCSNSDASPNVMDKLRKTPWHLALYQGNETVISALFQHGADPSFINGYGCSAMNWAQLDELLLPKITVCIHQYVATPSKIQTEWLEESIYTLSQSLLEPDVPGLGHWRH